MEEKDKPTVEIKADALTKTEEYCIVLDYLPTGKSSAVKTESLAQVIGKDFFTLLEVTPKEGVSLNIGEVVYVGKNDRPKINLIKNRIRFGELTSNSISEIEDAISDIVDEKKEKFLDFYNKSRPISLRRHQLELLPGLGKKHMLDLLKEREKSPFTSFEDIIKRVKSMPDPKKSIVKRVMEELEGPEDKHYLFSRPPAVQKPNFYGNKGFDNNSRNFTNRSFQRR